MGEGVWSTSSHCSLPCMKPGEWSLFHCAWCIQEVSQIFFSDTLFTSTKKEEWLCHRKIWPSEDEKDHARLFHCAWCIQEVSQIFFSDTLFTSTTKEEWSCHRKVWPSWISPFTIVRGNSPPKVPVLWYLDAGFNLFLASKRFLFCSF